MPDIYNTVIKPALKAFLVTLAFISMSLWVLFAMSCNLRKHMVKSESKTDSTATVKTETKRDSIVNSSNTTVLTEKTDNDITTKMITNRR